MIMNKVPNIITILRIVLSILFLIQLENVVQFSPNDETDPEFADALRTAYKNGVDIFVYSCIVNKYGISLHKPVEFIL